MSVSQSSIRPQWGFVGSAEITADLSVQYGTSATFIGVADVTTNPFYRAKLLPPLVGGELNARGLWFDTLLVTHDVTMTDLLGEVVGVESVDNLTEVPYFIDNIFQVNAGGTGGCCGIDDVLAIGQALTAGRIIDVNGNTLSITNNSGITSNAIFSAPGNVILQSNDGAGVTTINRVNTVESTMRSTGPTEINEILVDQVGVSLGFGPASDLRIDSAPGVAGQALLSQGTDLPPIWGNPTAAAAGIDDVLAVGQVLTASRTIDIATFDLSVIGDDGGVLTSLTQFFPGSLTGFVIDSGTGASHSFRANSATAAIRSVGVESAGVGVGQNGILLTMSANTALNINGDEGALAEVLTSQGPGVPAIWAPAPGATADGIDDVLAIGQVLTANRTIDANGFDYNVITNDGAAATSEMIVFSTGARFAGDDGAGTQSFAGIQPLTGQAFLSSFGVETNAVGAEPAGVSIVVGATSDLRINADPGTANDVLTSQGSSLPPIWAAAPGTTIPGIDDVLAVGQILTAARIVDAAAFSHTIMAATGGNTIVAVVDTTRAIMEHDNGATTHTVRVNSARAMVRSLGLQNNFVQAEQGGITFAIDATSDLTINADPGVAAEVLTSQGPSLPPVWAAAPGATVDGIDDVLAVGQALTASRVMNAGTNRYTIDADDGGTNTTAYSQQSNFIRLTQTDVGSGAFARVGVTAGGAFLFYQDVGGTSQVQADTNGINFAFAAASDFQVDGNAGVASEVLTSQGPNLPPIWAAATAAIPGIDDVLAIGQALTANRTVAQGTNSLIFTATDGVNITTALSNASTIATWTVTDSGAAVTHGLRFNASAATLNSTGPQVNALTLTQSGVAFILGGTSDFQINGAPGAANEVLTSQGANLPPIWTSVAAADVTYDNVASGMVATNVQTAIDELDARFELVSMPIIQVRNTDTTTNLNTALPTQVPVVSTVDVQHPTLWNVISTTEIEWLGGDAWVEVIASLSLFSTSARANIGVIITVNGNPQNVRGAMGYIRAASGHNESSIYVSEIVFLTTNDTIGVQSEQLSNTGGAVTMNPTGSSSLSAKVLQPINDQSTNA